MAKLIRPKYYKVPAQRAYFRHHKGTPEVHVILEETVKRPTPDEFNNICETSRFHEAAAHPPFCNCGAYSLTWEQ